MSFARAGPISLVGYWNLINVFVLKLILILNIGHFSYDDFIAIINDYF